MSFLMDSCELHNFAYSNNYILYAVEVLQGYCKAYSNRNKWYLKIEEVVQV